MPINTPAAADWAFSLNLYNIIAFFLLAILSVVSIINARYKLSMVRSPGSTGSATSAMSTRHVGGVDRFLVWTFVGIGALLSGILAVDLTVAEFLTLKQFQAGDFFAVSVFCFVCFSFFLSIF
jgi:hypothetical protein